MLVTAGGNAYVFAFDLSTKNRPGNSRMVHKRPLRRTVPRARVHDKPRQQNNNICVCIPILQKCSVFCGTCAVEVRPARYQDVGIVHRQRNNETDRHKNKLFHFRSSVASQRVWPQNQTGCVFGQLLLRYLRRQHFQTFRADDFPARTEAWTLNTHCTRVPCHTCVGSLSIFDLDDKCDSATGSFSLGLTSISIDH